MKEVYKVFGGELRAVSVEKVTAKMVYLERCEEFSYIKTIYIEHACVTPMEAIQEERNRALTLIGLHADRLDVARRRLVVAEGLAAKHAKEDLG